MKTLTLRCEGYHRTAYHRLKPTPLLRDRIAFYLRMYDGGLDRSDPNLRRADLYALATRQLQATVDCARAVPTRQTRQWLLEIVDEVMRHAAGSVQSDGHARSCLS